MGMFEYISHCFRLLLNDKKSAKYIKENITWLGAMLTFFIFMILFSIEYTKITKGYFFISLLENIGFSLLYLVLFTIISIPILNFFINKKEKKVPFVDNITIFYSVSLPFLFINFIFNLIPFISESNLFRLLIIFWQLYILIFTFKTAYDIPQREADKAVGFWAGIMFFLIIIISIVFISSIGLSNINLESELINKQLSNVADEQTKSDKKLENDVVGNSIKIHKDQINVDLKTNEIVLIFEYMGEKTKLIKDKTKLIINSKEFCPIVEFESLMTGSKEPKMYFMKNHLGKIRFKCKDLKSKQNLNSELLIGKENLKTKNIELLKLPINIKIQ